MMTSSSCSHFVVWRGRDAAVVDLVPDALVQKVDQQLHGRVDETHLGGKVSLPGDHEDDAAGDDGGEDAPGDRLGDAPPPKLVGLRHQRASAPTLRAMSAKTALVA